MTDIERRAAYLQSVGPDEFPYGYYLHVATKEAEEAAMKGDNGGNSRAVRTYGRRAERKWWGKKRRRQQDKVAERQSDEGRRDKT